MPDNSDKVVSAVGKLQDLLELLGRDYELKLIRAESGEVQITDVSFARFRDNTNSALGVYKFKTALNAGNLLGVFREFLTPAKFGGNWQPTDDQYDDFARLLFAGTKLGVSSDEFRVKFWEFVSAREACMPSTLDRAIAKCAAISAREGENLSDFVNRVLGEDGVTQKALAERWNIGEKSFRRVRNGEHVKPVILRMILDSENLSESMQIIIQGKTQHELIAELLEEQKKYLEAVIFVVNRRELEEKTGDFILNIFASRLLTRGDIPEITRLHEDTIRAYIDKASHRNIPSYSSAKKLATLISDPELAEQSIFLFMGMLPPDELVGIALMRHKTNPAEFALDQDSWKKSILTSEIKGKTENIETYVERYPISIKGNTQAPAGLIMDFLSGQKNITKKSARSFATNILGDEPDNEELVFLRLLLTDRVQDFERIARARPEDIFDEAYTNHSPAEAKKIMVDYVCDKLWLTKEELYEKLSAENNFGTHVYRRNFTGNNPPLEKHAAALLELVGITDPVFAQAMAGKVAWADVRGNHYFYGSPVLTPTPDDDAPDESTPPTAPAPAIAAAAEPSPPPNPPEVDPAILAKAQNIQSALRISSRNMGKNGELGDFITKFEGVVTENRLNISLHDLETRWGLEQGALNAITERKRTLTPEAGARIIEIDGGVHEDFAAIIRNAAGIIDDPAPEVSTPSPTTGRDGRPPPAGGR
jgi:hypothetical protein